MMAIAIGAKHVFVVMKTNATNALKSAKKDLPIIENGLTIQIIGNVEGYITSN